MLRPLFQPSAEPSLKELVPDGLASGRDLVREGMELAGNIEIGRSAFLAEAGVESELEYKLRMKDAKTISTHAQFGLDTVSATVQGLKHMHKEASKHGIRIDRFGLCMNQVMGLPAELRGKVPRGTGPILSTQDDWFAIAQAAPIQPHFGDFMIGSPASVQNATMALKAGVTTVGNLGQYFTFEYAHWPDLAARTVETVKALGIMAGLKGKGALVHSYLDDGYGGLFADYAVTAGWAMIERYIVEDLIGGKLAHAFGGLTSDPTTRLAWQTVLDLVHQGRTVGSMLYGDTVSLTEDVERNQAITTSTALVDILGQLRNPTAHAINPVPKTEPLRIPSPDEIVEAHVYARQMERHAQLFLPMVDFSRADALAKRIFKGGNAFFESSLAWLRRIGVDVRDPLEMMLALRNAGASRLERMFGPGEGDESYPNGRRPVSETDMVRRTVSLAEEFAAKASKDAPFPKGTRVIVASTDVHGSALLIISRVLRSCGAELLNVGPSTESPKQLVEVASRFNPQAIVITTHNGKALEYAKDLTAEMKRANAHGLVVMGGKLNQNLGGDLPVDVTAELNQMGIVTSTDPASIPSLIRGNLRP